MWHLHLQPDHNISKHADYSHKADEPKWKRNMHKERNAHTPRWTVNVPLSLELTPVYANKPFLSGDSYINTRTGWELPGVFCAPFLLTLMFSSIPTHLLNTCSPEHSLPPDRRKGRDKMGEGEELGEEVSLETLTDIQKNSFSPCAQHPWSSTRPLRSFEKWSH